MTTHTITASNLARSLVDEGIFNDKSTALSNICEELGKKQLPLDVSSEALEDALHDVYSVLVA